MAFIGNTNTTQAFTPAVDYFSGNGSTTAFTLSRPVASVAQVQAVVNNVAQNPSSAFTVSGNTITFTSAPSSGTNNIYVYYTSPITQVIAPSQGTVNTTSLGNITNIASGNSNLTLQTGTTPTTALTINTSQNVGIGTSSPTDRLKVVGGNTQVPRDSLIGSSATGNAIIVGTSGGSQIKFAQNGNNDELAFITHVSGVSHTEQARITGAGLFQFNSGYGSVATAYGCRAWVNFNGTGTVAIRASGNVTSITDNGTGDYTVNFTNAMPDANYSIVGSSGSGNTYGSYAFNNPGAGSRFAVGSCRINSFITQSAGLSDVDTVCVSVFR